MNKSSWFVKKNAPDITFIVDDEQRAVELCEDLNRLQFNAEEKFYIVPSNNKSDQ